MSISVCEISEESCYGTRKRLLTRLDTLVKKNQRKILIVTLALAFMWRLIYFLEILHSPYGNNLALDSVIHHDWAVKISNGQWLHDEVFFRAPLYPYFLGVIYSVFHHSQTAAKLIQMLLGCISCLLTYHIAKRLLNETAALIALIMSSFYGMFLYFENELLIVSLIVFLDLLGLLCLLTATKSSKLRHWFLSGLFLGLSAIARPNVLLFVVFLPLWIYFQFRKKIGIHQICKLVTALSIGCMIPILPVTIHNYVIGKDFVLVASQGGVNFYIGNNPESDGRSAIAPGTRDTWWGGYEDQINTAKRALGNPNARPSEISRYWYHRGLDFMLNNTFDFLRLTLQKLYLFWNAYEIGNNRGIPFVTRYSFIFSYLTFKFWFICPLAFAGIFLTLRRKIEVSLPLVFIFAYMVSIVMFFVCSRYRIPVIPLLIIFASYTVYEWLRAIVDDNSLKPLIRQPVIRHSLIIFLMTALAVQPITVAKGNEAQGYFNEGEAYRMKGDFRNAIKCYEQAKNEDPEYLNAYINMGNVYMESLYDFEKAGKTFMEALEIAPGNPRVLYNIGVLYLNLRQKAKARKYFLKTLEANPNHADAHINLGYIYKMELDYERALAEYLAALPSNRKSSELWGQIGNIYCNLRRFKEGREAFNKALEGNPNLAVAHISIAETYLGEGDLNNAFAHYSKALQIDGNLEEAYNKMGLILAQQGKADEAIDHFSKAVQIRPKNVEALNNLGATLAKQGRLEEAITHFSRALEIKPDSAEIRNNLSRALRVSGNSNGVPSTSAGR